MKIYMIGFMGCGKTHWGKLMSEKLRIPFFDLDELIVEKEEKSINDIFNDEGEEYFRLLEKDVLEEITNENETFVMACGGGTPCYFNNIDFLNAHGTTIWINCSLDCLHQRLIKEKGDRPLIKDLSNDQLRAYIVKKFSDRKIFYQKAKVILNEDTVSIESLLDRIFHN